MNFSRTSRECSCFRSRKSNVLHEDKLTALSSSEPPNLERYLREGTYDTEQQGDY